jgi:hypothetical protein
MRWRKSTLLIGLTFFISISINNLCYSQITSFEFWPEADIWYKINSSWRLSMITKYYRNNGQLKIFWQGDYQWGKTKHTIYRRLMDESRELKVKAWMVRGGFMEGWSAGKNAGSYTEDQVFAEIDNKIPLHRGLMVSHRLRFESRWLGEDPDFSYRIRYRVMLDKSLKAGKSSIVPFVNAEPYWDSRDSKVNRVRAITGATFSWGSRFAYECNFTYQWDDHGSTTNTYALGFKLHVYFETKHSRPKTEIKNS